MVDKYRNVNISNHHNSTNNAFNPQQFQKMQGKESACTMSTLLTLLSSSEMNKSRIRAAEIKLKILTAKCIKKDCKWKPHFG
jgi:hypothetical protein